MKSTLNSAGGAFALIPGDATSSVISRSGIEIGSISYYYSQTRIRAFDCSCLTAKQKTEDKTSDNSKPSPV